MFFLTWIKVSVSPWAVCSTAWRHQMHWYIKSQKFCLWHQCLYHLGAAYVIWQHKVKHCTATGTTQGIIVSFGEWVYLILDDVSDNITSHMRSVCTCCHWKREWGTSGGHANFGGLWWIPLKLGPIRGYRALVSGSEMCWLGAHW